jgi:hydrogenase maturation factor
METLCRIVPGARELSAECSSLEGQWVTSHVDLAIGVNTTAEATAIRIEYQSMSAKQITAPTITFALVSITKDPAISV